MVCLVMASILISRKGTAALLDCSVGMVDALARKGILEVIRLGKKKVMFSRSQVESLAIPPSRRRAFANIDPAVLVQ
jgi:hypothetical protein